MKYYQFEWFRQKVITSGIAEQKEKYNNRVKNKWTNYITIKRHGGKNKLYNNELKKNVFNSKEFVYIIKNNYSMLLILYNIHWYKILF